MAHIFFYYCGGIWPHAGQVAIVTTPNITGQLCNNTTYIPYSSSIDPIVLSFPHPINVRFRKNCDSTYARPFLEEAMTEYPMQTFHFQVEWGGTRIGFTEVSGLTIENQVIEYREGASPEYSPLKMPGLQKYTNIVLKRGIIPGDNEFFDWFKTITLNQVERRNLVISLLNENHEPVMVWKVKNAFPVKIEGPILRSGGTDVAIETLELAHEGLAIENG